MYWNLSDVARYNHMPPHVLMELDYWTVEDYVAEYNVRMNLRQEQDRIEKQRAKR